MGDLENGLSRCRDLFAQDRRSASRPPGWFDRLGFGGRTFFADGSQLYRAGGFGFLAPMALRAGKPLPGSAVVANENFFSHANLMSVGAFALPSIVLEPAARFREQLSERFYVENPHRLSAVRKSQNNVAIWKVKRAK